MTVTTTGGDQDRVELEQLAFDVETLREALIDQQMAADEIGWAKIGSDTAELLTAEERRIARRLARVMAIADPLISRACNLRTAYVWGSGVTIQARQEDTAEQDVNAVVQAFMDDSSNQATFTSLQAREELERALYTDGERFEVLVTAPLSGRVQVRVIPVEEIDDIVTNPDDATQPWFYRRTFSRKVIEPGYAPGSTRSRRETRTLYYPAVGYWPRLRPTSIDGHAVEWDKPVLHTRVNRSEGSDRGIGDAFPALVWAKGYKEFLEDWARLVKALSRFAFRATQKTKAGAANARARIAAAPASADGQVGQTVITGDGTSFEAIGKSGATIDSESGRPLAAMVAAASGIPVTVLLADPGVTGARATAETLDEPLRLVVTMRRSLHADRVRRILGYVIDQAIKAPQGPLKGNVRRDPVTDVEIMVLRGDQARSVDVDWPSLAKIDMKTLMDAIVAADETMKVPPLVILRMLLMALDVDNVDEVLEQVTDKAGNFVYPDDAAAARAQQDAVAGGDQP